MALDMVMTPPERFANASLKQSDPEALKTGFPDNDDKVTNFQVNVMLILNITFLI